MGNGDPNTLFGKFVTDLNFRKNREKDNQMLPVCFWL